MAMWAREKCSSTGEILARWVALETGLEMGARAVSAVRGLRMNKSEPFSNSARCTSCYVRVFLGLGILAHLTCLIKKPVMNVKKCNGLKLLLVRALPV